MLQRRSPHLCRLLRSPAVSVTLVRSASSTGYHNQQWDRPHDTVRTLQEDHLTQLDRLCSAPAHGSAAYLNRANRLRTGISKRILPFPRSELVSSSAGQPIWSHPSTISSANYSHVNLQQYLPCYAVQCRQFSLSATDYKGTTYNYVLYSWRSKTFAAGPSTVIITTVGSRFSEHVGTEGCSDN